MQVTVPRASGRRVYVPLIIIISPLPRLPKGSSPEAQATVGSSDDDYEFCGYEMQRQGCLYGASCQQYISIPSNAISPPADEPQPSRTYWSVRRRKLLFLAEGCWHEILRGQGVCLNQRSVLEKEAGKCEMQTLYGLFCGHAC